MIGLLLALTTVTTLFAATSGTATTAKPVYHCPSLATELAPTNNTIASCHNDTLGTLCSVTCAPGFDNAPGAQNEVYTCTSNGWVGSLVPCVIHDCGSFSAPTNNYTYSCTETTMGGQCTLACNTGYTNYGAGDTYTCYADGWKICEGACGDAVCNDTNMCSPYPCSPTGTVCVDRPAPSLLFDCYCAVGYYGEPVNLGAGCVQPGFSVDSVGNIDVNVGHGIDITFLSGPLSITTSTIEFGYDALTAQQSTILSNFNANLTATQSKLLSNIQTEASKAVYAENQMSTLLNTTKAGIAVQINAANASQATSAASMSTISTNNITTETSTARANEKTLTTTLSTSIFSLSSTITAQISIATSSANAATGYSNTILAASNTAQTTANADVVTASQAQSTANLAVTNAAAANVKAYAAYTSGITATQLASTQKSRATALSTIVSTSLSTAQAGMF